MYKEQLMEIGLTGQEAEVYLALLELGPSLASAVAKRSSLNRTNSYDLLARLIDKGLVSHVVRNNRKHFIAAKPETLHQYLDDQERSIAARREIVEKIAPALGRLPAATTKDAVAVYDGAQGIKTLLELMIAQRRPIDTYGTEGNFSRIFRFSTFSHYLRRIQKARIRMRVLFSGKPAKPFGWPHAQVRYLPGIAGAPTETAIFGDNVVIFVFTESRKGSSSRARRSRTRTGDISWCSGRAHETMPDSDSCDGAVVLAVMTKRDSVNHDDNDAMSTHPPDN